MTTEAFRILTLCERNTAEITRGKFDPEWHSAAKRSAHAIQPQLSLGDVNMTQEKTPKREGRILVRAGTVETVPATMTDQERILWPPTLPEKEPNEKTAYISDSDWYRRHEIAPAPYPVIYLKDSSSALADADRERLAAGIPLHLIRWATGT